MSEQLSDLIHRVQGNEIRVVSFDLFDTLLVRPVVQPTDLFKIVANRGNFGKDFPLKRVFAEKYARLLKDDAVDDITLSDIYHSYKVLYPVSEKCLLDMQNLELEVEFHYLQARESIKQVFTSALDAGKEVILASDMYLPKTFLESVLKKCGIQGYAHFYLSSDFMLAKVTGKLYEKIICDYGEKGIDAKQILHLGDNIYTDVEKAVESGIQAFHIPSAISVFAGKRLLGGLVERQQNSLDNSFMIGYLANCLFDDPFEEFAPDSIFNGNVQLMGKIVFAPLLLSFSKWMLEDCKKEHIEKILFVYRDGYLPEKIIRLLQPLFDTEIKTDTIYLSRYIRNNYFAKGKYGFMKSISEFPVYPEMTVENFAKKRLYVKSSDIINMRKKFSSFGYKNIQDRIGFITERPDLIHELEDVFHENANSNIEIIDDYCASKLGADKLAVFDVGYRGSVSEFLKKNFETDNIGYQIFSTPFVNNCTANVKTFVSYGFLTVKETTILHELMEDIISIDEGSSINIKKNGGKFVIEKEDKKVSLQLAEIQDSILDFICDFVELFKKDICGLVFDNYLHFELLVEFMRNPCRIDAEVVKNLRFLDSDFVTNPDYNLYENWYFRKCAPYVNSVSPELEVSHFRSSVYNWLVKHRLLKYIRPIYIKLKKSFWDC